MHHQPAEGKFISPKALGTIFPQLLPIRMEIPIFLLVIYFLRYQITVFQSFLVICEFGAKKFSFSVFLCMKWR